MANISISPNMNLPIPTIGVDPGPDWASNINASLTLIDQHNHASGSGVQITPAGLNINSDLGINGNNLTLVRTTRFQAQVSAIPASSPDLECIYVSGVDLYYNDGSGNQVRITQSGSVTGGTGSINNLTSPASASYNSGSDTFVWQSASNTPANMDFGSGIFRNITANSNGITVSSPNALASSYTLTLPTLPSVQSFMTLDNSGNISAPWTVDNSTLAISGSNIIIKDNGVTQSKLYIRSASSSTAIAGNVAVSSSSGSFQTSSLTPVDVTNLSVTLTTTGRPVILKMVPANDNTLADIGNVRDRLLLSLVKDGTQIQQLLLGVPGNSNSILCSPPDFFDVPTAASHTYKIQASMASNTGGSVEVINMVLIAYELN